LTLIDADPIAFRLYTEADPLTDENEDLSMPKEPELRAQVTSVGVYRREGGVLQVATNGATGAENAGKGDTA
jgi:hypothetical protein